MFRPTLLEIADVRDAGLIPRLSLFLRKVWRLPVICGLAGALLMQMAPAGAAVPGQPAATPLAAPAQTAVVATNASFSHSGMKTFTYEIGNALNNFVFLSLGAGGLAGGGLLTAFNTVQSWTVYTTNDYLWERFSPLEPPGDGAAFDVKKSVWRTTLKYMTGKPVVASIKIAAIYVYTGSAATALIYGVAATAGASAVFFVNNLAWDYYDHVARRAGRAPGSG